MEYLVLILGLAAVSAAPNSVNIVAASSSTKISGGNETTINIYPQMAAVLFSSLAVPEWRQYGGGTILNQRSILTVAQLTRLTSPSNYRVRLGSTYSTSGGIVIDIAQLITHPNFNSWTLDSDIGIMRTATFISYSNVIQPGRIPAWNYTLLDNEEVWAAGWGSDHFLAPNSEVLRHTNLRIVNQERCAELVSMGMIGRNVTENMLCTAWPNLPIVSQCNGDGGGPVIHRGTVIGITSAGPLCGLNSPVPGINTRVQRFTSWVVDNA